MTIENWLAITAIIATFTSSFIRPWLRSLRKKLVRAKATPAVIHPSARIMDVALLIATPLLMYAWPVACIVFSISDLSSRIEALGAVTRDDVLTIALDCGLILLCCGIIFGIWLFDHLQKQLDDVRDAIVVLAQSNIKLIHSLRHVTAETDDFSSKTIAALDALTAKRKRRKKKPRG